MSKDLTQAELLRRLDDIAECCEGVKSDDDPLWVARGIARMVKSLRKSALGEDAWRGFPPSGSSLPAVREQGAET